MPYEYLHINQDNHTSNKKTILAYYVMTQSLKT